jgi:steroid delta-isomerase
MPSDNIIASAVLALLLLAAPAGRTVAESAEDAIRATLLQWTKDFNAGHADKVCSLFSPELRYDFRGYPERNYDDVCTRLQRSLKDASKRYTYALEIREIIVAGDFAIVRLTWTLTVALPNGQAVTTVEPGMDIFRKAPDGQWKIVRYLAYEAPERPISGGE